MKMLAIPGKCVRPCWDVTFTGNFMFFCMGLSKNDASASQQINLSFVSSHLAIMKVILFPLLSLLLVTTGKVSRYRCIQRVIRIIEKPLLENLG